MTAMRLDIVIPVHRDATRAREVLDALFRCTWPENIHTHIRVVDDGSGDTTPDVLAQYFGDRIELVRLPRNRGRSGARNAASLSSTADFLLFLDADCVPQTADFLLCHLEALQTADVSIGSVVGLDDGFWHDYQALAVRRRQRIVAHAPSAAFTTQNVMMRARPFIRAGGFDESYVGYGFEDRDLALRLATEGAKFVVTPSAPVRHNDHLTLGGVCRKMREAGERTSTRFAICHPGEYKNLGYAAIDARQHPWRGRIGHFARLLATPLLSSEEWLKWRWLPLSVRAGLVRGLVAVSYLEGTRHAPSYDERSR